MKKLTPLSLRGVPTKSGRRSNLTIYILLITSLLFQAGCDTFRRKFVRESKTPKRQQVYYDPLSYIKPLNIESYKRNYLFWRTAHAELVEDLGSNMKRDKRNFQDTIGNLKSMQKLLMGEKSDSLTPLIAYIEKFKKDVVSGKIHGEPQFKQARNKIDKKKRQIMREFSPKAVKDFILPEPNIP
ncbi:MAG: hypothetical protein HQ593_00420 [Candidatus Omnitrophica bacterium]|nr:hypothetical protein [Candidatus Omnitrophota bacterium]